MLAGTEMNVLPDGSLDYDDDLLAELDWVVASLHTSFRLSEEEQTERMIRRWSTRWSTRSGTRPGG